MVENRTAKELKWWEFRDLWYIIGHTNICIIVLREGIENLFEEIMENIPNLVNEIDMQVQEAHSSKENEPKEVHTKTHHNWSAKERIM